MEGSRSRSDICRLLVLVALTAWILEGHCVGAQGSGSKRLPEPEEELPLHLRNDEIIKFGAKELERVGLYNPNYWVENNERSTSKSYRFWNESDVHFVEWPGVITTRDPEYPLLMWDKSRAKYLVNRCCESFVGIEMRAYAYRYVFLTWGFHRFMRTVTPPLTFPAELVRNHSSNYDTNHPHNTTELPVSDFVFVHDALVLTLPKDGIVILIHGLELAYVSHELEEPLEPLKYLVAKGITAPVNKLVGQFCCAKTDTSSFCPHGETLVAYVEYSTDFRIFISTDGGHNFRLLLPAVLPKSSILHSVLSYPDTGKLLVLHGTHKMATLDSYSMSTGALLDSSGRGSGGKSANGAQLNGITGMLQAQRIGEEMSLIIWDKCNVWYSLGEGRNVTKALFYVHGFIHSDGAQAKTHYILPHYCRFGENSSLAVSNWGKLALLDSDNHFHYGVDSKNTNFQLVALQVDMTLVLPKHSLSIVPHFDHSHHPKLVYPPRYLELDRIFLGKNYSQRLAIRLLPKTVFPSEFITVFYDERAWLPKKFKKFALRPCQTSSISVNRSISQKAKYYTLAPFREVLNFTVGFKSRRNTSRQLHYEPKDVNKFLSVRILPRSIVETEPEDGQYWFTYEVVIKSRSSVGSRRIFMLNFYTWKTLRCNIQPSIPVYVRVVDEVDTSGQKLGDEDDMSRRSFLRRDDENIEYGKDFQEQNPPGGCSSCSGGQSGESPCSLGFRSKSKKTKSKKCKSGKKAKVNPGLFAELGQNKIMRDEL